MFKNFFQKAPNNIVVDTTDLDMNNIPQHIAIIMDGNGRWAKAQGKVRTYGHKAGAEVLKTIVRAADKIGVKVLTVYAFSTENWKRPLEEVNFIMDLLCLYLTKEIDEFNANNVQVRFIGTRQGMSEKVLEKMDYALEATKDNTGIILNIAVNYGSQLEIVEAVRKIAAQAAAGEIVAADIDEATIENNLYTAGLPAPDLLIRPGGDVRISNFLLWQIAYAEIYYTKTYWPDFKPEDLVDAIRVFQGRERRFGGLSD
ncbi:MAG: isoprenyl transferase [Phascolarctobacterium sp.]|nr:isoprenyl transferase [Phascolarctobacterium sp.]